MASTLMELRKRAGYRTAREFAEALGLVPGTYTRWEANPRKIPLPQAWRLADWFQCPLDVIVGRDPASVRSLRGDVQEAYDSLSEESRLALDRYLAFLLQADAEGRRRRREADERRWGRVCEKFEAMYERSLEDTEEGMRLLLSGDGRGLRDGFEAYLRAHAPALGEGEPAEDAEGRIDRIMEAYAERNPIAERGEDGKTVLRYVPWKDAREG